MHEISKEHASKSEYARCKNCAMVFTFQGLKRAQRFGRCLLIAAVVIALLLTVTHACGVLPPGLAEFGGLVTTMLIVFGSVSMDRDSIIAKHPCGQS